MHIWSNTKFIHKITISMIWSCRSVLFAVFRCASFPCCQKYMIFIISNVLMYQNSLYFDNQNSFYFDNLLFYFFLYRRSCNIVLFSIQAFRILQQRLTLWSAISNRDGGWVNNFVQYRSVQDSLMNTSATACTVVYIEFHCEATS